MPACLCDCHVSSVLHYPPDLRDPVAAVTACTQCLNRHSIAIISEWPIVPPPNPTLLKWTDPEPQADGEVGG